MMTFWSKTLRVLAPAPALGVLALLVFTSSAGADPITDSDIVEIPKGATGSGNGALDIRLFTAETATNDTPALPGLDSGNTDLPKGGTSASGDLFYVTSFGDLQDFYDNQFGPNVVTNMMIFLDIAETTSSIDISVDTLDVVLNPSSLLDAGGNPLSYAPAGATPLSSSQQEAIAGYTLGTGTTLAYLDTPPDILAQTASGTGFPDYGFRTGINPYAYARDDTALFHWSSTAHVNGGETVFLSGLIEQWPPQQPPTGVAPDPATWSFFSLVGCVLALRRRACKARKRMSAS